MIDLTNFAEVVKYEVEKMVGAGFKVKLNDVRKNNGIVLKGVTITENGNNIFPTVYLNDYYKDYKDGRMTIADAANGVVGTYHNNQISQSVDMRYFLNYEKVSKQIVYKLINTERNKELLKDIPHVEFLDLSIVFQCMVSQAGFGMASILIHNAHQKLWEVSVEDLYRAAKENTQILLGHEIKSMSEVLCGIMEEEGTEESDEDYMLEMSDSVPMYVLTNKQKVNGAACMLYPDLIRQFSDRFGKNLFIIPSSVHELLLLPADHKDEASEIRCMIREINDTQVRVEEILSYSLYLYDRQKGEIITL